jgi:beta-lactamase regulating signal transducer with metallopeptidase domain
MPLSRLMFELGALPAWVTGVWVVLAKATIVLIAGLAITRSMSRASADARHLIWLVVLGALLALPALTTWARLEMPLLPSTTGSSNSTTTTVVAATPRSAAAVGASMALPPTTDAGGADRPSAQKSLIGTVPAISSRVLFAAIWAGVSLLILASLAWSSLVVRKILRRARPLEQPGWRTPLLEVADRLGLGEMPQLLVSRDTTMPFACGLLRPTIVLPETSGTWTPDRRRAVLFHELAHVRRRDLVGHALSRIVCALYWFHPLAWVAAKQLRTESERACDDLALNCGTRASDYAEHLLDIVTAVRSHATPTAALAMARRKEFEGRMLAILDPDLRRSTLSRRQSAALMASLALSTGLIAAAAPVSRTAAHPAPVARSTTLAQIASPVPPERQHPTVASRQSGAAPAATPAPKRPTLLESAPASPSAAATTAPATTTPSAESRGGATDPDDRPALLAKVLRSDPSAELRRVAAWGLEQYAEAPEAIDALVSAVAHDADVRVREMAAWSLGSSDGHGDAVTALSAALRTDAKEEVRATAAWALGNIGADGSTDALGAALGDANPDVRSRAAWALGTVGTRHAPPALVALLRDRDKETRQLAAWALYQIEDASALPALEAALRTETDEETQLAFVRAIAVAGDKSVDVLRGLLESPDARVKSIAVRALAGGRATGPWPWPWPEPRPEP